MRRWAVAALLLLCACKAELGDGPSDASPRTGDSQMNGSADAAVDGTTALGPWGAPTKLPGADTTLDEDDVTLSSNELELFFKKSNGADQDIYVMTRASTSAAFGAPVNVSALNSASGEESPRLSSDDLTIYFGRAGDIYKSTRATPGTQTWTSPVAVTSLNTANNEKWADVCSTGYAIVSRANGANGQDLYEGTITGGATTLISQLNTASAEQGTLLTKDCLGLYFQSNRDNAQFDIYMSTRTTLTAAWSNPTKLTDFNTTTNNEEDPWIGTSQRTFAFASNAAGNKDLYISTR